jgi:hypothetical protein
LKRPDGFPDDGAATGFSVSLGFWAGTANPRQGVADAACHGKGKPPAKFVRLDALPCSKGGCQLRKSGLKIAFQALLSLGVFAALR